MTGWGRWQEPASACSKSSERETNTPGSGPRTEPRSRHVLPLPAPPDGSLFYPLAALTLCTPVTWLTPVGPLCALSWLALYGGRK